MTVADLVFARPALADPLAAYVDWVRDTALPTWATRGFDARAGRFCERLDRAGDPLVVPHRAMVQARQIYVYAHAARLGWHDGGALAERAMAALRRDFGEEGATTASFAFSIDGTGAVVSPARDAYTHAFILFALAWLAMLTGERRLLALADKVIAFMDAEITDPAHGGLFDQAGAPDRCKRQNPVMHLLEAYLFLAEAAPDRGYLERAGGLVRLFERRFFRASPGVLLEYLAEDWAAHPAPERAGAWEPGHHFEWVWLLDRYARMAGERLDGPIAALHAIACDNGIAADGFVSDELDLALVVTKPSRRVWPHTEAIKAATARAATGDADAPALARRMAERLLAAFLDRPFAGGWIDRVGADGAALVDYVPASSLYHLFLAAAEAGSRT